MGRAGGRSGLADGLRGRVTGGALAAALTIAGPLLVGYGTGGDPASSALAPFGSCDALRQWYVDQTIGSVGPYGWRAPIFYAADQSFDKRAVPSASAPRDAVTDSATGTNVQQAGVDEPDVAKTDGRIVVRLRGPRVVITDVSGVVPHELASWTVPGRAEPNGLLLVDGHVLLAVDADNPISYPADYQPQPRTEVYDLDVSVPSDPRLVSRRTWSGQLLALRQYGGTVRLVTTTGLPALPFVHPRKGLSPQEATTRNRRLVRDTTVQQWLPWRRLDAGTSYRSVDCASVYHARSGPAPGAGTGVGTLGVYTLRPGDRFPTSTVAVVGRAQDVYSSGDRLYVFDAVSSGPGAFGPGRTSRLRPVVRASTEVHAFSLDGEQTRYLASGLIDGSVRDRWSFDEHDGYLRVAVSWPRVLEAPAGDVGPGQDLTDNGVVVLAEQGDRLVQVGRVHGLGTGEQVQSVRWFDDLAVVVTYHQVDPLWTVDLRDPAHPRLLGELRLPGYSAYLHPVGGDRLLGLGATGAPGGPHGRAEATVFDIDDLAHPRVLGQAELGESAFLGAASDPHDFTWVPAGDGGGTAITSVTGADGRVRRTAIVHVSQDGRVSVRTLPSTGFATQRALPLPDGRVALVGERVRLITLTGP